MYLGRHRGPLFFIHYLARHLIYPNVKTSRGVCTKRRKSPKQCKVENPLKYEAPNPSNKQYGHQLHENMGWMLMSNPTYFESDFYDRA